MPLVTRPFRFALLSLALAGCQPSPAQAPAASPGDAPPATDATAEPTAATPLRRAEVEAIVAAEDRDPADREADARRAPVDLLLFIGVAPGMKIADIGAGFGYTTELLARAVGPTGQVYGQNPRFVLERFAEAGWSARLAKPVMANVTRIDREFGDPLPPELHDLDAVVNVLFYHDFEWMGVDRAAHAAAILRALRPGGVYVLVDHSAKEGAGTSGSQTLHRIEEAVLRKELEAAGFELAEEASFLRNPSDARDWNALPWQSKREEQSDRFVLKFRRPI